MPGGLTGGSKQQLPSMLNNAMTSTANSSVSDAESSEEIRSLDCNLTALCEHVQAEGWNAGLFSDITVHAMGSTYYLHRLILSRSSIFRHMLQGPWKEAGAREVTLQIDDENVNGEAVAIALSYLYGHHPKLNDGNAFRVLAAACFFDLQDLCTICTEFIISEIWTDNFLSYQAFAESQDYGIYGERVRKACWGYLCRGGAVELKDVLQKLSTQTLRTLLTSDELWVPNEEKRFGLALNVLISRCSLCDITSSQSSLDGASGILIHGSIPKLMHSKSGSVEFSEDEEKAEQKIYLSSSQGISEGHHAMESLILELADAVVNFYQGGVRQSSLHKDQGFHTHQVPGEMQVFQSEKPGLPTKSQNNVDVGSMCRPFIEMHKSMEVSMGREACSGNEGHESDLFCTFPNSREAQQSFSASQIPNTPARICSLNDCSKGALAYSGLAWGGRVVGRRRMKVNPNQSSWIDSEDWDAFMSIFEGGGVLYCHMAFEDLLQIRARLEEFDFPCKAISDGLWVQTLLRQHVLNIVPDTCKTCCLFAASCTCKHAYTFPHSGMPPTFYRDDQERTAIMVGSGGFHSDMQPSINSVAPVQGRVHVRSSVDGLAGIGRGSTFGQSGATWSPSRFMFTRIPFTGFGNNRHSQQSTVNDITDVRADFGGIGVADHSMDGLPAVVRLSQSGSSSTPMHSNHVGSLEDPHLFGKTGESPNTCSLTSQTVEEERPWCQEWESNESISLDLETPLRMFPPFRFGVEFDNVHRLADGQSKHSPESFYAGSYWKVSVQAFHNEDPQGRRTLGLFLHRRRAEYVDLHRKVYLYTDNREKVTARYQLICSAKREVMVFGTLTQAGTLLPKSPKGWGWRTAFLFDELADLLQGGALRVAAVVQLV